MSSEKLHCVIRVSSGSTAAKYWLELKVYVAIQSKPVLIYSPK